MTSAQSRARSFLAGEALSFADADVLWRTLRDNGDLTRARAVLARLRDADHDPVVLLDAFPSSKSVRLELCQQEALLTSKDEELSAAVRHTRALEMLAKEAGDLADPHVTDVETLGIAAGILKRRWNDLGQLADLQASAALYERGARGPLGEDAYAQVNAAFLDDLLAHLGSDPAARRTRAAAIRERVVAELPITGSWWNAASRAEALFGLRRYRDATAALANVVRPESWKLESSARQLATLAHLQEAHPLEHPDIRAFFAHLLPSSAAAVRSAFLGKVGLALSGGGFRASFYHLGVLARLAELDVLRHVDVLSCVSGGSIVGVCYWLALRRRMLTGEPLDRNTYIDLVRDLIAHFQAAVALDVRGAVQPSKAAVALRLVYGGEKGALDPEEVADVLERDFYRPLLPGSGPLYMDELPFTPADHTDASAPFDPVVHNWLRAHKVPELVVNATTVNTGHAWHFTPHWMGESPWTVHEAADVVPRLQWAPYNGDSWRMRVGRAVAASACVPGVFSPVRLAAPYESPLDVRLVDGGVYDNQGTVALLARNCNVLLVSDAAGQLLLEPQPAPGLRGLLSYASRAMDTLMERVRQGNFGDLSSRRMTGVLRGMMFLHMKAGLDADVIRLDFAQEAYAVRRSPLTPSGIRRDVQQALAELRTDLNVFTPEESLALMAGGFQMASKAFDRDLVHVRELYETPVSGQWPFADMLRDITSTRPQEALLSALKEGNRVHL